MELKVESKIGTISGPSERIYSFLSDFTNFRNFIPPDKVKNFEATPDQCTFEADGLGKTGLKIIEKDPFKTVKITGISTVKDFIFWIQLKETNPGETKIRLTLKAEMNLMMKMMAEKPMRKFVDTLVDRLSDMRF